VSDSVDDLFEGRPATVFVEGVGEVPVLYTDDEAPQPLPDVDLDGRLALLDGVDWTVVDDEVVVWESHSRTSHVLNTTAALLWQCIDGVATARELLVDLADAFGVPIDVVAADFVPVIAAWKRDALVSDGAGDRPRVIEVDGWRLLADPPND
jgi:hypothetical protein